jgi:hypothetical protein
MKSLTRKITVLIVLSLATLSPAPAQTSPEGKIRTFTISGDAGLPGVMMKGLPGNPVTDNNGSYSAAVNSGWIGTVTPMKEGYSFEPASKIYTNVANDRAGENYAAKIITYTISGQVDMPGVEMQGLPGNPVTDENGLYSTTVDYGWAGTVKPVKEAYTFKPASRSYTKVTANQNNQNYAVGRLPNVELPYAGRGWEPMQVAGEYPGSRSTGRSARFRSAIASAAGWKVLVVPDEEVNAKDLAALTEDMQVMSHILDERFKETRRVQGVFTDFGDFFGRDNRQTEAIYLQGYGVLFSMEVNFAFSPPQKQQQQQAEQTTEPVDSTWQRARQQVFSSGDPLGPGGSDSTEEYDSQMVEELKRDLITTLKHAANIRGVQPDEWVILTIIGGGRQSGGFGGGGFMMGGMGMSAGSLYGGTSSGGMGGFGGRYGASSGSSGMDSGMMGGGMGGGMMGGMGGVMGATGGMGGFSETGISPATVLTIRAKKADIDDFAKNEQDFEQFRQKVQIFTY